MIILTLIAYFYLCWILYVVIMGTYRAHLTDRLTGFNRYMSIPIVVLGIVFDIIGNLILATIIFMDVPREWMFTDRLKRYKNSDKLTRRSKIATYICDNILDPFDPRNNHC